MRQLLGFFEKGLNVMEFAAITGHKDLRRLQRHTHLRAKGLGPLEAENEATRCLKEIDEEYDNNFSHLNKMNGMWG